jgi:hypothetical protein
MVAKRKKTSYKRGAHRKNSNGIPAWMWMFGGILIGLGTALALMLMGYLPELKQHLPAVDSELPGAAESALVEGEGDKASKPKKPRYDFFTVLPEMEVVVPELELKRKAAPMTDSTSGRQSDSYILQAGSFKSAADAEQMKARLALMGSMATVQTVTVNGETWHRVRLGPFEGARKTDEMRRLLSDNQIDTLVMKTNP